jgi:AraC family transcriptional regulator
LYAVFKHKGATSSFHLTSDYIFNHWIPQSEYELDHRPHFEILGDQYLGPDNPESEEEVWIPIKPRKKTFNATEAL